MSEKEERDLVENRDRMSLLERVEARRRIDEANGVSYPELAAHQVTRLARVMADGLRRIANQK